MGTLATLKRHREIVFSPAVAAHRGRIVKLIGDGTLTQWLLYGYVVSRLLHFAAYFTARTHDTRATLWTVGSLILIFMTCRTLAGALGY